MFYSCVLVKHKIFWFRTIVATVDLICNFLKVLLVIQTSTEENIKEEGTVIPLLPE
jgi:hypothetical protein